MKTLWIISLLTPLLAFGSIYEKVDANGHVIYSDQPFENSKKISLGGETNEHITSKIISVKSTFEKIKSDFLGTDIQKQKTKSFSYKNLQITTPKVEESFWNVTNIAVQVSPEPKLNDEHNIQLYLNNSPLEETNKNGQFNLKNLVRGEHTITAYIVDNSGKKLLESSPVKFFVHRKSVQPQPLIH